MILVAAAVLASACGGSNPPRPGQGAATSASATGSGPLPVEGPAVEQAFLLAQQLVERIGDTNTAMDALLIGGEHGYSGPQLIAAVESDTLQADGTIQDVDPDGPRLYRIDFGGDLGEGIVRNKIATRPAPRRDGRGLIAAESDDQIVLERLRDVATNSGASAYDREQVIGLSGVMMILILLDAGATPEQVIDALVLGVYFYEEGGVCYSQALPIGRHEPEMRACDGQIDESPPGDGHVVPSELPATAESPAGSATYEGNLDGVLVEDPESSIVVTVSPNGTVSGHIAATEQLDNYIASIDLCGLLDDEADCGDSVESCPATVAWSSDLSTLQFTGTPPDSGTVTGTITMNWDTTPHGCGQPSTDTPTFGIEATVSPNGAQITSPVQIDLARTDLLD